MGGAAGARAPPSGLRSHGWSEAKPVGCGLARAQATNHAVRLALNLRPARRARRRMHPTELHLARDAQPTAHGCGDPPEARVGDSTCEAPLTALCKAHVVPSLGIERTELAESTRDERRTVRPRGDHHLRCGQRCAIFKREECTFTRFGTAEADDRCARAQLAARALEAICQRAQQSTLVVEVPAVREQPA